VDSITSKVEPLTASDRMWLDAQMQLYYTRQETLVWAEKQVARIKHALKINELDNYVALVFEEPPF